MHNQMPQSAAYDLGPHGLPMSRKKVFKNALCLLKGFQAMKGENKP